MDVDIITIEGATGMCAGYNAGMKASTARYKVYLHQDVFILERQFLRVILSCFAEDPLLALIGVLGTDHLSQNASAWDRWTIGTTVSSDGDRVIVSRQNEKPRKGGTTYMDAEAVDGMCMVTAQDLPWREDLFDRFDYYDISQSTEFLRAGWKIGVARQVRPLCMHDCGKSKLLQYDHYREIFCKAYGEPFCFDRDFTVSEQRKAEILLAGDAADRMESLIDTGLEEAARKLVSEMEVIHDRDNRLCAWWHIERIFEKEMQKGRRIFWQEREHADQLMEKYHKLRFLLRRVENNDPEAENTLRQWVRDGNLSMEAVEEAARTSLLNPIGALRISQ